MFSFKFNTYQLQILLGAVLVMSCVNSPVQAQYYSQSGTNLRVVVDKTIRPINETKFWDNITPDQKVFAEGDQVEFKIVVENKGDVALTNLTVTDLLPKYLSILFNPGIYDKSANKVVITIDKIEPGQNKEFLIRVAVNGAPISAYSNQKLQQTNKVTVVNNEVSDSDEAKYFIGMKSVPVTGTNDLAVKTIIVLTLGLGSLGIRRLARGY